VEPEKKTLFTRAKSMVGNFLSKMMPWGREEKKDGGNHFENL